MSSVVAKSGCHAHRLLITLAQARSKKAPATRGGGERRRNRRSFRRRGGDHVGAQKQPAKASHSHLEHSWVSPFTDRRLG